MLDAISFICETAKNSGIDVIKVREDIADYRDKQGIWSREFVWEGVGVKVNNRYLVTSLLWWRGLRGTCELAVVAIKILGAPVTFTERSFSTFGWIHSKKRNRLTSQRVAKLTYLAYNWKLKNGIPKSLKKTNQETQKDSQDQGEEGTQSNEDPMTGLEVEGESELSAESEPELRDSSLDKSDEDASESEESN